MGLDDVTSEMLQKTLYKKPDYILLIHLYNDCVPN